MRPSMLVANVRNELLASSLNLPKLAAYLNTVNEKNDYSDTVWYAVLPSVSLDERSRMSGAREGLATRRSRPAGARATQI